MDDPGAAERGRQLHGAVGESVRLLDQAARTGTAHTSPRTAIPAPLAPGPPPRPREVPRRRRPGTGPGAWRSTGRSAARPIRRPARRPAPRSPAGGYRSAWPSGVPDGGAPGDPGAVHQPGHRAVISVVGVALPGGEYRQERGRRGTGDRIGLFQFPQAVGLGRGRKLGRVGGGQVPQPGATMSSASRAEAGAVPTQVTSSTGTSRCWRYLSSPEGRLLGSEFDSTARLRIPRDKHAAHEIGTPG